MNRWVANDFAEQRKPNSNMPPQFKETFWKVVRDGIPGHSCEAEASSKPTAPCDLSKRRLARSCNSSARRNCDAHHSQRKQVHSESLKSGVILLITSHSGLSFFSLWTGGRGVYTLMRENDPASQCSPSITWFLGIRLGLSTWAPSTLNYRAISLPTKETLDPKVKEE